MTLGEVGTGLKNVCYTILFSAGTMAAGCSALYVGKSIYNKVTGSNVTMGDTAEATFKFGALLAEWACIFKGGSKM